MAVNDVNYDHVTVDAGGSEASNNTLAKIGALEGVDADVLLKLNPNIAAKDTVIGAGIKVLVGVGSITNKVDEFNISTLRVIDYEDTTKKELTIEIRNGKNEVIKTDVVKVSDKNVGYLDMSLETIVKNVKNKKWYNKELDVVTLMKLNPWIAEQDDLIARNKIVILEVYSPGESNMAEISACGIRANSTRTCYIRWDWNHEVNNTSGMEVRWRWRSTDGEEYEGSTTDVSDLEVFEAIYTPDESAIEVTVSIRPKEKTSTSTSLSTKKNKYSWSTVKTIYFHNNWSIATPSAPNVEIKQNKLTATYESLPIIEQPILKYNPKTNSYEIVDYKSNVTHIQFEIVKNNSKSPINTATLLVGVGGYIQYNYEVKAGHKYRVRARCCNKVSDKLTYYSSWSEYSSMINSAPDTPELEECEILKNNVVEFRWNKIESAEVYVLQYLMINENDFVEFKENITIYFNSNESSAEEVTIEADKAVLENDKTIRHTQFNIESGHRYLSRVKAINEDSESTWSNVVMFTYGKKPDSPTTWSTSTKAFAGDSMNLYWIHNSKDNSVETMAEIEFVVDGVKQTPNIFVEKSTDEDKRDEPNFLDLNTISWYKEIQNGCKIVWRVRTAGVLQGADKYGPWSIQREINIYSKPEPTISLTHLIDGEEEGVYETLRSLPLGVYINMDETPNQSVIGYVISVVAQSSHTTVDEVGNEKAIVEGSSVFSKYYNADQTNNSFEQKLSAKDISLENNQSYKVICTISMSSGLIIEISSEPFQVGWITQGYQPNAEIGIDMDTLTAHIRPFCGGGDSVNLFVYRREFDGTFTEIIADVDDPETGIENGTYTWVTDPHPALDYARYRIISRHKETGAINYYDVPSVPVQEKSVVIQWDEKWQNFNAADGDAMMSNTDQAYAGSILKLKYNIDVSNSHSPDVSLVRYTGRSRPVSYYGTQRGETATWNMEIPKSDTETLYALRRLAIYMGDVYVREPSGSGYWASINISFSQAHRNLTIPITINITPVEGGM